MARKNPSWRLRQAAESGRDPLAVDEAQKASRKTYRGTIHVEVKAPDQRAARKAFEAIRPAYPLSPDVELRHEGPQEVRDP